MNKQEETDLIPESASQKNLVQSAKDFMNGVLSPLKGKDMGQLVVIELKRDGQVYSPVLQMLRQLRIQPHGFSKYCMGSALTGKDHLPVNRFKCKLIEINKLVNQ